MYAGLFSVLVAVVALRIRRRLAADEPVWLRSATLIAGATLAVLAAAFFSVRSAWPTAIIVALWVLIEIAIWLPPIALSTRLPIPAVDWLFESCVAVLVGAFASRNVAAIDALRLLALTAPAGASIALAAIAGRAAGPASSPGHRALLLTGAVGASAVACGVAVTGFATRLPVEHALFASMVGVLIVALGYAGLIDPRPDDRVARVGPLLTVGMLAVCYGNAVVLLILG